MHLFTFFPAVTLEVAESEVSVNEGDRVARVCARMIGLADFAISAIFTTTDDSAESPDDYDHSQREIVFPADSSTPQCAEFSLVDDNVVEFMEKFNVTLSVGTRHARVRIGESDTVVVTIDDNDCKFRYRRSMNNIINNPLSLSLSLSLQLLTLVLSRQTFPLLKEPVR